MGELFGHRLLIVSIIAIISIVIIICQICKKRREEREVHRRTTRNAANGSRTYRRLPVSPGVSSRPEAVREFGPVNYYANTKHNQKDCWFQFMYRLVNGEWLTYIIRMPGLNGRDGNLHLTHRYKNGDIYWICYDPQPRTLKDAQIISRAWGDRELEYITTGVPFEEQHW